MVSGEEHSRTHGDERSIDKGAERSGDQGDERSAQLEQEHERSGSQGDSENSPAEQARALFAEALGTFALTFVAAGAKVIAVVSAGAVSEAARAVVPGLVVMAMIYAIGDVSGAHVNPAVTLAFALRRAFPWRHVPLYWAAQVAGAVLAALLLRALFGMAGHLGTTEPHHGVVASLVMEIVLTLLYVLVTLGTATGHKLVGSNAGMAIGATIALDGLFGRPISGASMNPAHSLGPAIVAGSLHDVWIYVAGPFAGALLAAGCMWLLRGSTTHGEGEKASGQGTMTHD